MGEFRYIGLPALLAKQKAAAAIAVTQGANELVARAQAEAPKKTGALAASIHTDGIHIGSGGIEAHIQTGGEVSDYAIAQHEGAGPHVIEPRNGKALAFNGIVVRRVNHPGNPATKFLEGPLLQFAPEFKAKCVAAMRAAF